MDRRVVHVFVRDWGPSGLDLEVCSIVVVFYVLHYYWLLLLLFYYFIIIIIIIQLIT
jgi:hypothetical protein